MAELEHHVRSGSALTKDVMAHVHIVHILISLIISIIILYFTLPSPTPHSLPIVNNKYGQAPGMNMLSVDPRIYPCIIHTHRWARERDLCDYMRVSPNSNLCHWIILMPLHELDSLKSDTATLAINGFVCVSVSALHGCGMSGFQVIAKSSRADSRMSVYFIF